MTPERNYSRRICDPALSAELDVKADALPMAQSSQMLKYKL